VKFGDLVRMKQGSSSPGFVMRIDKDHYGARQAFKVYKPVSRGKCVRSDMVDGYGPTKDGIRDRVLVHWPASGQLWFTYEESSKLEVISEGR